jgi:Glycosyltransferase family 87
LREYLKAKRTLLLTLIFVQFLLLLVVIACRDTLVYNTIKEVRHVGIDYNSRSLNPEKKRIKTYYELDSNDIKELDVHFKMKVYSIGNNNNVFQTAQLNDGVRLELSSPSTVELVVKQKDDKQPYGFILSDALKLNTWYLIRIHIDTTDRIRCYLDGTIVANTKYKELGKIEYIISEIAVGSGFNKTRIFDGEITDFAINYKLSRQTPGGKLIIPIVIVSLLLSILAYILPFLAKFARNLVSSRPLKRESKINLVSLIILIGFIISVGHYAFLSLQGFHGNVYDYLLNLNEVFDDFSNQSLYVQDNNPYALNRSFACMFPFLYRMASFFAILPDQIALFLYVLLFSVFFLFYTYKNVAVEQNTTTLNHVLILTFLSFPFMFTLSRGNYEAIVFIFLAVFVYYYEKGNIARSILPLSLAISMKLFPAIFLILLLSDKKYKEAGYTVIASIVITIMSYASFAGGLIQNIKMHLQALQLYNKDYAIGNAGLSYGHSLFGAIKILSAKLYPSSFPEVVNSLFGAYALIVLVLFGLISVYIFLVERKLWKKVTLLVFSMLLFPHVSADYRLIHLFIPLYLFINKSKADDRDLVYGTMFSLLLIVKSYYYFQFDPRTGIAPFSTDLAEILNPAIMTLGILIIIASGIYSHYRVGSTISCRDYRDSTFTSGDAKTL